MLVGGGAVAVAEEEEEGRGGLGFGVLVGVGGLDKELGRGGRGGSPIAGAPPPEEPVLADVDDEAPPPPSESSSAALSPPSTRSSLLLKGFVDALLNPTPAASTPPTAPPILLGGNFGGPLPPVPNPGVGLLTALCSVVPGGKEQVEEGGVGSPSSALERGMGVEVVVVRGGGRRKGLGLGLENVAVLLDGGGGGVGRREGVRIGGGGIELVVGSAFPSSSSFSFSPLSAAVALGSTFHPTGSACTKMRSRVRCRVSFEWE